MKSIKRSLGLRVYSHTVEIALICITLMAVLGIGFYFGMVIPAQDGYVSAASIFNVKS